jgi:hypothetical protein
VKLYPKSISDFGYVGSLQTSGYTGESGGWKYQELAPLQDCDLGDGWLRLCFRMKTDGDGKHGYGWYIDNIRMFISVDTTPSLNDADNDIDNDGLTNGEEFYDHGTCPLNRDSDFDGIMDGVEVKNTECWFGYNKGGDPHVRNIFIEVDYLTGDDVDWRRPKYSDFEESVIDFKKHDIICMVIIDEGLTMNDDSEYLSLNEMRDDFYIKRTAKEKKEVWHYFLWGHKDSVEGKPAGLSRKGAAYSVIYAENFDHWPNYDRCMMVFSHMS